LETVEKDLKTLVDDLRQEWKVMWRSRIDDKVRAEGIADKDYIRLFVDRGMILFATRNFKPPEFQEILQKYLTSEAAERVNPNPIMGGIRKFIREYIISKNEYKTKRKREMLSELEKMKRDEQFKHGGRGWLHLSMPKT